MVKLNETKLSIGGSFNFNRAVDLITKCIPAVEAARNHDKLLFIGGTGVGKSTLLNYLYGARYNTGINIAGKPYADCIDGIQVAEAGYSAVSQTLYPLVMKQAGLNYVYCDLPGLNDNRGPEERICASSGMQILSRLPGDIKGILVVLDLPGLNSERGSAFKNTAIALARMLKSNPELMDSVHFIITKVPPGKQLSAQKIIDTHICGIIDTFEDTLESEMNEADKALLFMLKEMEKRVEQIHIPNINDHGQSANAMIHIFKNMPTKKSHAFDFLNHDASQKLFNSTLLKVAEEYVIKNNRLKRELPEKILEIEKNKILVKITLEQLATENNHILHEIELLNQKLKATTIKLFGNNPSNVLIRAKLEAECSILIERIDFKLNANNQNKKLAEAHMDLLDTELKSLNQAIQELVLEVNTNMDLFVMVYKISRIIHSNENQINNFWKDFENNNAKIVSEFELHNSKNASITHQFNASSKAESNGVFAHDNVSRNIKNLVKKLGIKNSA